MITHVHKPCTLVGQRLQTKYTQANCISKDELPNWQRKPWRKRKGLGCCSSIFLFWALQSVLHYLSRGFWARLCTRAHAWLFRGCSSTGTLRGSRTGFWSSSSLTPEWRWSTKGQSKHNSVTTQYFQLHTIKKIRHPTQTTQAAQLHQWSVLH